MPISRAPYSELLKKVKVGRSTTRTKASATYMSFFCGGGGLDLGFASAGFKPLYSSDIVPVFCQTVAKNLKHHIVEPCDITEFRGSDFRRRLRGTNIDVDVVIGGPPCQSFSILGDRKSTQDPRGKLVYEYARVITELSPRAFLFENVPGILTIRKGADWANVLQFFKDETGYHLTWRKLNSVWFGVPQYRQRVILIGFKRRDDAARFKWPQQRYAFSPSQPELGMMSPYTAGEALEGVHGLPNHILRVHGERVTQRYSLIPQGGRDRKDHTDRIHLERPSGTVLVGSGAGGGRPFIHPTEHRHITVREAARLQSFPDWWVFAGGPTAAYRQVGNAVPPLMANAVASEIKKAISTKSS
jgi:DNA (cytosine-5)-methyltransferase 1